MGIREDVRDFLAVDATLLALLPGGLWAVEEISRQGTPAAFDANGEILPCGLVHLEVQTAVAPYPEGARQYLTLICYQRDGYAAIDAALDRAFWLLNRVQVGAKVWEARWTDDSQDLEDPGLSCAMRYSRYMAVRQRG